MVDARVTAAITMFAVLRGLEDLCELDADAERLARGRATRVSFAVRGVGRSALTIGDGRCVFQRDAAAAAPVPAGVVDLALGFASARHFNAFVDKRSLPVPLRGARHLGYLREDFTALTARLEEVLQPGPVSEALTPTTPDQTASVPTSGALTTMLTAYTAFYAVSEVGNRDPLGRLNAAHMPDGTVDIAVTDGPSIHITATSGHLVTAHGPAPNARATMTFDSMETAGGILAGTLDTYACIGDGRLSVSGFIPMLDHMNKLLAQVSAYLT